MRNLNALALILVLSCTTGTPTPSSDEPAGPYGLTVAEEARILALEDRRQFDAELTTQWVGHANPLHRQRIALYLARVGPHEFVDGNENGLHDRPAEKRAGVAELSTLSADPDRQVRELVAFALGEIGDAAAGDLLFQMAQETDGGVAAEAIEALSKLAVSDPDWGSLNVNRYGWMTADNWPEGVRARAARFLFRFRGDAGSRVAEGLLASPSPAVRQEAAYSLARKAIASARPQLELLVSDASPLTRAYAVAALGKIADAASKAVVLRALGDIHPWVRTNAAVALSRILEQDAELSTSDDLPRIFAAVEDPDPGVRAAMIDVLAIYSYKISAARQRIAGILRNSTRAEREIATGAIMSRLGPAYLERWKYEPSPWALVRALEFSRTRRDFRERYVSHPEPLVRMAVAANVQDESVDQEIEVIRTLLDDPDVIVRATAIEKYAKVTIEDPAVWLARLEKIEQDERKSELNDARLAAIRAIAEWDRPERGAFLHGFLQDPDPVVRRVAADLIFEKGVGPRPRYTPLPVSRPMSEYEEIVRWSRLPHTATIHMTRGKIEMVLLTRDAPMTAWNFARLAQKKYFDNTTFMRVVPNFVIQGGDPRNDQNGGPGYAIRDEINLQKYTRGAVGMALSGADTGGSQFFVTHSPQPHLDGGYTIFGRVFDGMSSVVDQVERGDRVVTITIDEHPPVGAQEISSVPNVSLPLVVGPITPDKLLEDIPEYARSREAYHADLTVLEMMKSYVQAGDRIDVFMGTWCADSQREVPKLLRITDDLRSQFGVEIPISFVAMDRTKVQPEKLLIGKSISKVATFIYYRQGKELGRIEERPTGLFEDDLLAIAAKQ